MPIRQKTFQRNLLVVICGYSNGYAENNFLEGVQTYNYKHIALIDFRNTHIDFSYLIKNLYRSQLSCLVTGVAITAV